MRTLRIGIAVIAVLFVVGGLISTAQYAVQCHERNWQIARQEQEHETEVARLTKELRDYQLHPLKTFTVEVNRSEEDIYTKAGWADSNISREFLKAEFWRLNANRPGVHNPLREGDQVVFPTKK